MTGRLILLRHGQTYNNQRRTLDTRPPGAELTDLGRSQAAAVGEDLVGLTGIAPAPYIVSSIAIRAQQTAVAIAAAYDVALGLAQGSTPIDVRTGIHEIFAGTMEGQQGEEAAATYTQAFHGWLYGDEKARLPEGENYLEVLARYQPVLESLIPVLAERDCIVVSHGAAIRTVSTHATDVDPDFAFGAYLPNCRFVILRPGEAPFGQWTLERWADTDQQI
ncbi:histidine phosphatase family protein [Corynebacterium epidermidicanis]|uniref:Fructose-2,6-bisphosphatase n=1 Tax=Corynebacterium epidermidicanis TaxID=1050174 RepID=A0A0G3GUJ5_9CORY|nr:histidine phosphatase family protein [Corynebacterium epidermidicanis]AKK04175.1 fructose-2,6-bisphosphatase [Corynebacterium epidermidicanis]